jgi:hypothetical protein
LYDSEINVTVTREAIRAPGIPAGGLDFALVSYMSYHDAAGLWQRVNHVSELAERLHRLALRKYPNSTYAKRAA